MKIEDMKDGATYLVRRPHKSYPEVGVWREVGHWFETAPRGLPGFLDVEVIRELDLEALAAGAHVVPANARRVEIGVLHRSRTGQETLGPIDEPTGDWVSLTERTS